MQLTVLNPAAPPTDAGPRDIAAVRILRVSLTDRCNFRCVYCMPETGVPWIERGHILRFEEIRHVVRAAVEIHGIRRVKLTGGEPTVRRGLVELVAMLRAIDGIEEISLTTNGALLSLLAAPLRAAGLDRITVSIDSLRPDRFRRITRIGDLPTVLRGMDAAASVGFLGTKINCVAMRGVNDDELVDFAQLSRERRLTVRFIEYMPLGESAVGYIGPSAGCDYQQRGADVFIPEAEMRHRIERELGPLVALDARNEPGVGPARVYRLAQGEPLGRIGFISAMSAPFCDTCNRLRLTADGILRSCLFDGGEIDLKPILRRPSTADSRQSDLAQALADCVQLKPRLHAAHGNQQMSRIGG